MRLPILLHPCCIPYDNIFKESGNWDIFVFFIYKNSSSVIYLPQGKIKFVKSSCWRGERSKYYKCRECSKGDLFSAANFALFDVPVFPERIHALWRILEGHLVKPRHVWSTEKQTKLEPTLILLFFCEQITQLM